MSPVIEKTNNLIDRLHTSQILVGLDVGFKTIGIAVSDKSYTIATPLNTVLRKGTTKDLIKLKEYLIEYEIGGFVTGLPISLDGSGNDYQPTMLWLLNKFSLSVAKEMDREEYGEYTCTNVVKVLRIMEMITNLRNSWLLDKFSLLAP